MLTLCKIRCDICQNDLMEMFSHCHLNVIYFGQLLTWDVGKINPQKLPSLKGTMSLQAGASKPDENPTINIQFKIQQMAISGTLTQAS